MILQAPDLDTLRAYVAGELSADDADLVRRWLIVAGDEPTLTLVERLHAEVHARAQYWSQRPQRARFVRAVRKIRRAVGHSLEIDPFGVPLAGALRGPRPGSSDRPIELEPGREISMHLRLGAPTWVAVYALETESRCRGVFESSRRRDRDEPVMLDRVTLDLDDEPIELLAVFDPAGPIERPPANLDPAWLVSLLDARRYTFLHATIAPTPMRA